MKYYKIVFYFIIICLLSFDSCVSPPPQPSSPSSSSSSSSGPNIPQCDLSYMIKLNDTEKFRGEIFEMDCVFLNENHNDEISDIIIFGNFVNDFEVVGVSHPSEMTWDRGNFEIKCSFNCGEQKNYTYYLRIKKEATCNYSNVINSVECGNHKYGKNYNKLIKTNGINIAYNNNKVRLAVMNDNSDINDEIEIKNNIPKIIYANATIISPSDTTVSELHLLPDNGSLLYKYKDKIEPLNIWLNVTSYDEDDDNLNYTWIISPVGTSYNTNKTSYLLNMSPQKGSLTSYSYSVYAEDKLDKSKQFNVNIIYEHGIYDSITIINVRLEEKIKICIIIIVFLCMLLALVLKFYPKDRPYIDRLLDNEDTRRYLILVIPPLIYFIITTVTTADMACLSENDLPYYLTSLALFEVFVFIDVFIFIILFTQHCFSQQETKNDKITATLWFVNLVGMTTILLTIILIIPRIDLLISIEEQLQWYYSTMAQVFASILAIVAVFYTALPNKNIVSINLKKGIIEYNHPSILRLFIIIYGFILGLVLLGLSSGVHLEFPTYITFNLVSLTNLDNLANIFSLILFETTLLMIPPAISSLYALIRITAFTGTVKIQSKPRSAKIYLEGYDTGLITPTKLMLRNGEYDLSFKIDKNPRRVFSWDEIPGNDNERLKEFLVRRFCIDWVSSAKIEKYNADTTIKVYAENNSISIKLNNGKTVAILEIEDGRIYRLIAKMEKGKLNIYYNKQVKLFVKSGTEKEYYMDVLKLEQDNSDNSNICDYLVSSKYFK